MIRTLILCAVVTVAATPLSATTIRSTLTNFFHGMSIQYSTNGTTFTTGSVGLIQGTRATGAYTDAAAGTEQSSAAVAPGGVFYAFCVELTETTSLNTSYLFNWSQVTAAPTSVAASMNDQRANLLGELLYRNVPVLNQSLGQSTTAATELTARSLQLAIWEIVHEQTTANTIALSALNVTTGNVRFARSTNTVQATHDAVITQANTYLAQLTGAMSEIERRYRTLTIGSTQDLLIGTPEPGTFFAIGIGLTCLFAVARRRKTI
ncbi:MAG TPA: PEP-CTERM sorting domain-containing protein [Bryobacteraceae bacterium]|nr:PEP-CTERM sorting domain-containing protein [Bryobacteraceae bacterium]